MNIRGREQGNVLFPLPGVLENVQGFGVNNQMPEPTPDSRIHKRIDEVHTRITDSEKTQAEKHSALEMSQVKTFSKIDALCETLTNHASNTHDSLSRHDGRLVKVEEDIRGSQSHYGLRARLQLLERGFSWSKSIAVLVGTLVIGGFVWLVQKVWDR